MILSRFVTKPATCALHPVFSQISLSICTVHMKEAQPLPTLCAHSNDSDQTGWMPRLIRVFAGHKAQYVCFYHTVANIFHKMTTHVQTNHSKTTPFSINQMAFADNLNICFSYMSSFMKEQTKATVCIHTFLLESLICAL